jgi:hypothetical protein
MNPADGSDLWQSALKCRLRTLAISSTTIFDVAIRGQHTAVCHGRVKDLRAEFSNRVKSSSRHFTSETACLKSCIYLKSDFISLKLIRGALFRSKLYVVTLYSVQAVLPGEGRVVHGNVDERLHVRS